MTHVDPLQSAGKSTSIPPNRTIEKPQSSLSIPIRPISSLIIEDDLPFCMSTFNNGERVGLAAPLERGTFDARAQPRYSQARPYRRHTQFAAENYNEPDMDHPTKTDLLWSYLEILLYGLVLWIRGERPRPCLLNTRLKSHAFHDYHSSNSSMRNFARVTKVGIKVLLFGLLVFVGIPPSLVFLRPTR